MGDLISRDALLKDGIRAEYGYNDDGLLLIPMRDVMKSIENASAVDAVEVVRCKDCKHRHSSEFCECRDEMAFCSDGKKDANVEKEMTNEALAYVSKKMTARTGYEGLAEECCELAQAALKVIRAANGENPTPMSWEECTEKVKEEAGDVMMYLELMGYLPRGTTKDNPKWERWAKRIRERGA